MSRGWCNQMSMVSQRSWRVARDLLVLACGQEQMSTLVNMSFVLDDFGGAELPLFSSFDCYLVEAVERLEEGSLTLLLVRSSSCVVPEKSNAIIGVVTAGFERLPPSCDGLTGSEDHGPMISPVDTSCWYRG
ncbi:GDSL esterase/lipase-like [Dorcoceras hygrometricum]|uniref:GDSL esterase/lipase-like n=1 Tax=Dorcoceras hygrometricum TaxID=472368 RepID=A0A2Z7AYX3_9LAMI|nr:GDSL esterase/lipase-like [Dorcoceras hygrometricum]